MARAYSTDLRERVVRAVQREGLSRRQAAARFGVSVATAINWLKRLEVKGSVAPGRIGGHKLRAIRDGHADWLRRRCRKGDFTLRGLVVELCEQFGLRVDYRSVWQFVHTEKLSYKKRRWSQPSRNGPMLPGDASSG